MLPARKDAGMFTLYATPRSANGRKVLAAVHHLGLSPEIRYVDVYKGEGRSPSFLAVNPLGKIPALVDGDLVLWESNALLTYIAEAHGDHQLWSRAPKRRADIARWIFWESSAWQPSFYPILVDFVRAHFLGGVPIEQAPKVSWEDENWKGLASFLDAHLEGRSFLTGEELTLADLSVAAMMMYVRPAGFPFDAFPNISAWYERIEALPAWKASAA
jgi:glutathione S-transferase